MSRFKVKSIEHQNKQKMKNSVSKERTMQRNQTISLLPLMKEDQEFSSIISAPISGQIDIIKDARESMREIEAIRGKPAVLYVSDVINNKGGQDNSIVAKDDLLFNELVNSVPKDIKDIDFIIATPGGSGVQVSKFVDKLRSRFENVSIIIPNIAMSAGTILAMSGDEIIMTNNSYIGPIDPQVPNRNGIFVPAQSIQILINDIQKRGQEHIKKGSAPNWTDLEILRQIDPKEIGATITASAFSSELVENYLYLYKFRTWNVHSKTGVAVTDQEKRDRAKTIAAQLCNHDLWKSHSKGITREIAWSQCMLKTTASESIDGLDRAIRRMWALFGFIFERTPVYKVFLSNNLSVFKSVTVKEDVQKK